MSLEVVFINGPAEGLRRSYPHLDLALHHLFLLDDDSGRPGAVYGRLDTGPSLDGSWRYRLIDTSGADRDQLHDGHDRPAPAPFSPLPIEDRS